MHDNDLGQGRRWLRLDNAAKIYPAARRRNWTNVFRLSATLNERVDACILQSALAVTVRRFPSICVRLRRGIFWYYLEELSAPPAISQEREYPLTKMHFSEIRQCAFRVLYYENRISVEIFHALTDGNGGLIFLKTLVAEYLSQRYRLQIPSTHGVLDRQEAPSQAELEDSFLKYHGPVSAGRGESSAYRLRGTREADGFLNLTTGTLEVGEVLSMAKSYGVSLTAFLAAVLAKSIMEIQDAAVHLPRHKRPVKVLIPVNLRNLFHSKTLRNFVLYITPEIDPRMGTYTFEEIVKSIHHQMGVALNDKTMGSRITANVRAEQSIFLKVMPLFIKNAAMKLVFNIVGERKSCLSFSNLGRVELPAEMAPYVKRFDFYSARRPPAPTIAVYSPITENCTSTLSATSMNQHWRNSFLQICENWDSIFSLKATSGMEEYKDVLLCQLWRRPG